MSGVDGVACFPGLVFDTLLLLVGVEILSGIVVDDVTEEDVLSFSFSRVAVAVIVDGDDVVVVVVVAE